MIRWHNCIFALICTAVVTSPLAANTGASPAEADREALRQLRGQIVGQIVWESNRTGSWQLYTMNADGTGARHLTAGPGDHTYAQLSGNGKRIVYCKKLPGRPGEVWLMNNRGQYARKLIDNASYPRWRKNDTAIQFLRKPNPGQDEHETWEYDLETQQSRRLFPTDGVEFEPKIELAWGNDEASRCIVWSPRPRGTWVLSADGNIQEHVHGGCCPRIATGQRYAYGVKTAGQFIKFNLVDGKDPMIFNKRGGPWSHTYFPCLSRNQNWLVYGACPPDQHDQNTSDYEIFLIRMNDWKSEGEPIRLTFNTRTDRWPTIYVASNASEQPLPDGPYDVAENRRINMTLPTGLLSGEPDRTPPTVDRVISVSDNERITVIFSEPVDAAAAQASNYEIKPDVEVKSVSLASDARTATLTTSALSEGNVYTLTVSNIADWAFEPNVMAEAVSKQLEFVETPDRVGNGLLALYQLEDMNSTPILDVSGVPEPLHLSLAGDIISSGASATKIIDGCKQTNALSIEAWLKPANTEQDGPARIVTLSAGTSHRNFTLGQEGDKYRVRLRTTETSANGIPSISGPAGSLTTERTHFVYTRSADGSVHMYKNGSEVTHEQINGDLSNWDDGYSLALTNEMTRDRPWLGDLYLVAIYKRALSSAEVAQNFRAGVPD